IVFGGKRHLALAGPLIHGASRRWPSPFDRAVEEVVAHRGRLVCVLASGDPYLYGVGSLLARHVDPSETVVVPAPSAFTLPAARPARLASAGRRSGVAARPRARSHPPAPAPRREGIGADLRWRRPGRARATAVRERLRRLEAHRTRSSRWPARTGAHRDSGGV